MANIDSNTAHKQINKGVNRTKRTANVAASRARHGADSLEGKVNHFAEDAGSKLHEFYNSSIEHAEEGAEQARTAVRDNPLVALAGAFFGGFVLAAIMRR